MTSGRAAALYALALLPIAAGSVMVTGTLFDLTHYSGRRPASLVEWLLNVVPPLVVGAAAYTWLARLVRRRQPHGGSFTMHIRRTSVLYLIAVVVGVPIIHDAPSQDFWSLGQLAVWPWLATVAGIFADAYTTRVGRQQA